MTSNIKLRKHSFIKATKKFKIIFSAEMKFFFSISNIMKNTFSIIFPILILVIQLFSISRNASINHMANPGSYYGFFCSQYITAILYIIFWRIRNILSQKIFVNRSFISYQLFTPWKVSLSKTLTEYIFFIISTILILASACLTFMLLNIPHIGMTSSQFFQRVTWGILIVSFTYVFIRYLGSLLLYAFNKEIVGKTLSLIFIIFSTLGLIVVNSLVLWIRGFETWIVNHRVMINYIPFLNFLNISLISQITVPMIHVIQYTFGLLLFPTIIIVITWFFYIKREKKYLCSFI